jgi:hypothetical protein
VHKQGLCGDLFISRRDALRYALREIAQHLMVSPYEFRSGDKIIIG